MRPAEVHGTFLVLDIEKFSGRDDRTKSDLRRVLLEETTAALKAGQMLESSWEANSTGDGLLVFVQPTVPMVQVVEAIMDHLTAGLREHNRKAAKIAHCRVRAVVHHGPALRDENGISGGEVVLAFRICDADPLREHLRQSTQPLVLALSDYVYQQSVVQRHGRPEPEWFQHLPVQVKETKQAAWVYDHPGPGRRRSERTTDERSAALAAEEDAASPSSRPVTTNEPSQGDAIERHDSEHGDMSLIRDTLVDDFGVPEQQIVPRASLTGDLGLTRAQAVEVIIAAANRTDTELPDDCVRGVVPETVAEAIDFLLRGMGSRSEPLSPASPEV